MGIASCQHVRERYTAADSQPAALARLRAGPRPESWLAATTTRHDDGRSFRVDHWEYDADRVHGFDYDIGTVLVGSTLAIDQAQLLT